MCPNLFTAVSVSNNKGTFSFLEDIIAEWFINLFIQFDGKTPTKLLFKSLSPMLSIAFSI